MQRLNKITATFTLLAFFVQMFSFTITAQFAEQSKDREINQFDDEISIPAKSKIAPDLEENSDELARGFRQDETQKVIIRLKSDTSLNEMFSNDLSEAEQTKIFAQEVQANKDKKGLLMSDLMAVNGRLKKSFNNLGLVSAELPLSQIRELIKSENVEYISPDREISANGHLETTTGTAQIRSLNGTKLDGTGIGIAVIDSGIDSYHHLHSTTTDEHTGIVYSKDFTGGTINTDPFGHGTHVAAIATGHNKSHSKFKKGDYRGIAPMAKVINLRALDNNGRGNASNVVAAIDWAIANKTTYNIRVINMSLGTAAKDSYKNDPLCLAARRAFNAGIVVVASAGNNGKSISGNKQYGTIGSPGIEPTVITVGASNSFGTDARSDDTVASFSSRGPTRGYVTLTNGARKYDNLIKPDLIAPGNKIISADAPSYDPVTSLRVKHPTLPVNNGWGSSDKIMYLSGTSVATPVVSGAVALMLQANPSLTPNLVKAILMYSAQPLNGFNTLEQGAGMLNVDGAARLSKLVKTTLPTTNGTALLTGSLPTSQTSTISGQTVNWGKGVITNFGFLSGNDLMVKWQGMYSNGLVMGDGTPFVNGSLTTSSTRVSGTPALYQGVIKNNGLVMGDGTLHLSTNAMAGSPTPVINGQGILVSDGVLLGDGLVMGDGLIMGDGTANSALGDNTSGMLPAP